jgi:hypothetical protein
MWQPDISIFGVDEGHSRMGRSMRHCLHPVQCLNGIEPPLPTATGQVFSEKLLYLLNILNM